MFWTPSALFLALSINFKAVVAIDPGSCPDENKASFGERQQGFCVLSNGNDQNSGVINLEAGDYRDGDNSGVTDEVKVEECLKLCACYSGARVTGCEMIWDQGNRGCYVHTDFISHGNNVGRHSCYLVNGGGTNFAGPPGRVCKAAAWGDPHIVTWDGLRFDAQPQGEVILARGFDDDLGLEIQGRLEKAGDGFRGNPAVTTGIAVKVDDATAVVHVAVPTDLTGTSATNIDVNGYSCPVELVVNGDIKSSLSFNGGGATVTHSGQRITITFSSTLSIVMRMSHFGRCYFSVDFFLYDCDSRADSVIGLLGSPNRDSSDDWMTKENVVLNQPSGVGQFFFEPAFLYSKQNWMIDSETDSLFTYSGDDSFERFYLPSEEYDSGLEQLVNDVDTQIQQICAGDIACIIDGETLGIEAAHENQDNPASHRVTVEQETIPDPEPSSTGNGSVLGDPHIKTWKGELYDFHGVCDLVMVQNPYFESGLGMDIHIRTKRTRGWSYIANAVLRIGEETLEIMGGSEANYWINGVRGGELDMLSGFEITHHVVHTHQREFRVKLNRKESVFFKTFKDMIMVNVENASTKNFGNSLGLLGSFGKGEKKARDNLTIIEDDNEFGQEWQVRANEAKLFHNLEGPQAPKKCELPSTQALRRRLGESKLDMDDAKAACARVDPKDFDICVFDVLATEDADIAGAY